MHIGTVSKAFVLLFLAREKFQLIKNSIGWFGFFTLKKKTNNKTEKEVYDRDFRNFLIFLPLVFQVLS